MAPSQSGNPNEWDPLTKISDQIDHLAKEDVRPLPRVLEHLRQAEALLAIRANLLLANDAPATQAKLVKDMLAVEHDDALVASVRRPRRLGSSMTEIV